jgi:hypothetical protein
MNPSSKHPKSSKQGSGKDKKNDGKSKNLI